MRQAILRVGWFSRVMLAMICLCFIAYGYSFALTPRHIAEKALPSVVLLVMGDTKGDFVSFGSGFFVHSDVVVTNSHVIEDAARGYVKIVGQEIEYDIAGIVGIDTQRDLVLLKIRDAKSPLLVLGDSREVAVGDEVYVIGNPRGLEGTFSEGIVSGIRQTGSGTLFQITAPIWPGSSGGPVLNAHGEVIGVVVSTFTKGLNLNFAIPASYLALLLQNMKPALPLSAGTPSDKNKSMSHLVERIQSGGGIKAGYFVPSGGDAGRIRGTGSAYGIDYLYTPLKKSYGVNVGFEYLSQVSADIPGWTVIVGEASLLWFPAKVKSVYVGAGVGYYNVEVMGSPSLDESDLGFHFLGGYTTRVGVFVEIKYSNAKVEDVEAGGLSIQAGIRF